VLKEINNGVHDVFFNLVFAEVVFLREILRLNLTQNQVATFADHTQHLLRRFVDFWQADELLLRDLSY